MAAPAFFKNPKFIGGTIVFLWVAYVVYWNYRLNPIDRWLYRYVLIPRSRERLIDLARWLTLPHVRSDSAPQPPFSTQRDVAAARTP